MVFSKGLAPFGHDLLEHLAVAEPAVFLQPVGQLREIQTVFHHILHREPQAVVAFFPVELGFEKIEKLFEIFLDDDFAAGFAEAFVDENFVDGFFGAAVGANFDAFAESEAVGFDDAGAAELADEFLELKFVRERDGWSPTDLIDGAR